MNEDELLEILLKDYPDCEVEHIAKSPYYADIRALALVNNLTVTQYLRQLGFIMSRGILSEEEAITELIEAFPDGKIHSFWQNHNKAARSLTQIADKKNKTLDELLADYGMETSRKDQLTPNEAINILRMAFPDGKGIQLISKIQ